jgi:peptide/nickel transport system ATP-binding protein
MTETKLEVDNLTIAYDTEAGSVRAVEEVSLALPAGTSLGLVGESGSGKSTLALGIMRLLAPGGRVESGSVTLDGEDILAMDQERFRRQVRWKELAMVFQSAMNSLNPVVRIGAQLSSACRLHEPKLSKREAKQHVVDLFGAVGLTAYDLDRYPHELSGGMRQRTVIALSLVANPHILIADEATTALDVLVQDQILRTLSTLRERRGLGLIVISHDIDVIAKVCDDVLVMYAGRIVERGKTDEVLHHPSHPYTAALLAALPTLTGERRRLASLPGAIGISQFSTSGCRFAPRCPIATDICWQREPGLLREGHAARCHFAGDQRLTEIFNVNGR